MKWPEKRRQQFNIQLVCSVVRNWGIFAPIRLDKKRFLCFSAAVSYTRRCRCVFIHDLDGGIEWLFQPHTFCDSVTIPVFHVPVVLPFPGCSRRWRFISWLLCLASVEKSVHRVQMTEFCKITLHEMKSYGTGYSVLKDTPDLEHAGSTRCVGDVKASTGCLGLGIDFTSKPSTTRCLRSENAQ